MSSFDPSALIPRYSTAHEWCYDTNGKPYSREHITQRAHQWMTERIAEMYPPARTVTPGGVSVVLESSIIRYKYEPQGENACLRTWILRDIKAIKDANFLGMPTDGSALRCYHEVNAEINRLLDSTKSQIDQRYRFELSNE